MHRNGYIYGILILTTCVGCLLSGAFSVLRAIYRVVGARQASPWAGQALPLHNLCSDERYPPLDKRPQASLPRSGKATVKERRPATFPHRIWAACDFEGRTPDYGWFGPAETHNVPRYPGNATALGVGEKPYQNFSALMTGINPVPGPRMGKVNKLYLRY